MRSASVEGPGPHVGSGCGRDGSACQVEGAAGPSEEWHLQSHADRRTGSKQPGNHHLSTLGRTRGRPAWEVAEGEDHFGGHPARFPAFL